MLRGSKHKSRDFWMTILEELCVIFWNIFCKMHRLLRMVSSKSSWLTCSTILTGQIRSPAHNRNCMVKTILCFHNDGRICLTSLYCYVYWTWKKENKTKNPFLQIQPAFMLVESCRLFPGQPAPSTVAVLVSIGVQPRVNMIYSRIGLQTATKPSALNHSGLSTGLGEKSVLQLLWPFVPTSERRTSLGLN